MGSSLKSRGFLAEKKHLRARLRGIRTKCDSLWEKGALHAKIEIEIKAPEVRHRKNSLFLLFLFFAELVLVTLTLSLRQISNAETT